MRSVQLQSFGLEGLKIVEGEIPEPGPDQVVVKMAAASLNYHDLVTVLGKVNPNLPMPVVPLSDGCGTVVATGDLVSDLEVGERVVSLFYPNWTAGPPARENQSPIVGESIDGVLTEYALLQRTGVARVPDYLTDTEAASLPCAALTAWRSLVVEARIKAGDTVLLQGTGGVSIFGLQFAKMLGAEVILTSSSDEKLQRASGLGADHLINYRSTPQWAREAKRITAGLGVDHVMEVGGAGTFEQSLRAIRIDGHIGMIGVLSGWQDQISTARMMVLNANVKGITVGNRGHFEDMVRAMDLHRIRPVISHTLAFEAHAEALSLMQRGGHFGKICLSFSTTG